MKYSRALASVFPFLMMGALGSPTDHLKAPELKPFDEPQFYNPLSGISPKDFGLHIATKSSFKAKMKRQKAKRH